MTYQQVVDIIGEEGTVLSESEIANIKTIIYDNSFDGVINNVKVEPAAGTLAIVQDDKKSVLEKLKEQSKQVQAPVPVSDRKPVPGCCFEREFQGW